MISFAAVMETCLAHAIENLSADIFFLELPFAPLS